MAKPFRRKKRGKFVGNWFVTLDGEDINLLTKDAAEASRRARGAARGEWPPVDGAAAAAAAALEPNGEPPPPLEDPETSAAAVTAEALPGAGPQSDVPSEPSPAPGAGSQSAPPAEPLHAAAAAAAGDASAAQAQEAAAAEAQGEQAKVDAKLADIMAKLGGPASGGADVLGTICNMAAGLMLAAERKTLEWGGTWALRRRGDKRLFLPGDPPELMHDALAAGLHGYAVTWFPNFAMQLTPGWAVVLGLVGGGGAMMIGAKVVEPPKSGEAAPAAPPANGAAYAPAESAPPA